MSGDIQTQSMNAEPRVSVIVPAYNHERFIEEALDSVVGEGYPNLEIVIIDDGSTDRTWKRIEGWVAGAAGVVEVKASHQSNRGLTRTLNRLLELCSGPYVVYLASDDRLLPGGIAARVDLLEANPNLYAVFGDCRVIDAAGNVTSQRGAGSGDPRTPARLLKDPAREIVSNWSVAGSVILYRKDEILSLGGYSQELILEDWDFYLRLAASHRIAFIDRIVSDYRMHGANTVERPSVATAIADEMVTVAWRSRRLFSGHLRMELMHETATWAARAASLRKQPLRWLTWKASSVVLKLVARLVPHRQPNPLALRPVREA